MTPFCTAIPNNAINPTAAETLKLIPVANRIRIPPIIAKGTFKRINKAFLIDINAQNNNTKIKAWFEHHSAIELVKQIPDDQKNAIRWYIDSGDDDFLYEGNTLIHILMRKKNIHHEFRTREGVHNWTYWREALPKVLEFVSDEFHQK